MNNRLLYTLFCVFCVLHISAQQAWYRAQAAYEYGYYDSVCMYASQCAQMSECNELYGKALYVMNQYDTSLEVFKTIHTSESWFYQACLYARQQNADSAIHYLYLHMGSDSKKPYAEVIQNVAFDGISKTSVWREFWKHTHYSDEELLIEHITYNIANKPMLEVLQVIENSSIRTPQVLTYKALALAEIGDKKQAQQLLATIPIGNVLPIMARAYSQLGLYSNAFECLQRYTMINTKSIEVYYDIATVLYQMQRYEEAQRFLSTFLSYYYKHDGAWYLLSLVYQQQKNYLAALPCLHKACELKPGNVEYIFARANLFMEMQQFVQAELDYNQCLDLQLNMYVYFNRAHVRRMQGNMSGACYDYSRSYKLGNKEALEFANRYCKK